MLHSTKSASFS